VRIASVIPVPTRYIDAAPIKKTAYQVSAMYGTVEGERSETVLLKPVGNIQVEGKDIHISPVIFTNQVEVSGYEWISKIEVFTATGRMALQIEKPERIIHTESLRSGVYFFRLYTGSGFKVVKGVRR
jgi:hypothetical protein